jgi:hypothetical protein
MGAMLSRGKRSRPWGTPTGIRDGDRRGGSPFGLANPYLALARVVR